jgi:hypothetical protein
MARAPAVRLLEKLLAITELGSFEPATVRVLLRRFDRSLIPALDAIVASSSPPPRAAPGPKRASSKKARLR